MPTGYTADIENGITFYEFALNCSRAFGALVHLRDEPNAKIPDEIKPSEHHLEQLIQAELKLKRWVGETQANCAREARVAYESEVSSRERTIAKEAETKRKYQLMLKQARAYTPPTPDHENFRKFMIEQLEKSIEHDCGLTEYYRKNPVRQLSPDEYRKLQIETALDSIKYHVEAYQKEIKNCEIRTAWLRALKESLEPYRKNPNCIVSTSPCDAVEETPTLSITGARNV